MAQIFTFDGPNRLIILGNTEEFTTMELYSRWKEWMLESDNSKYEIAMRTVGGDPISDSASLGATFFLLNGWQIRPSESSHRLSIVGNIFTDPAGTDVIIPTLGTYTVLVEMRVSNLTDATLINSPDIQYNSFAGGVHVDVLSAYTGTEYPVGTPREPVNNLADAVAIANSRGFETFHVKGNLSLDPALDYSDKTFIGESKTRTTLTLPSGAVLNNCEFLNSNVTGVLDSGARLRDCRIEDLSYVNGYIEECVLHGDILVSGDIHLLNCWGGAPGDPPVLDLTGGDPKVSLWNYSGQITVRNKTGAAAMSVELNSGLVILESTVTAGTITVRGVGRVEDNSVGASVTDETLGTTTVAAAVWAAVVDGSITAEQSLRLMNAILGGKVSGAGTGVETFRNPGDTKDRAVVTVDSSGNRTTVVRDLT